MPEISNSLLWVVTAILAWPALRMIMFVLWVTRVALHDTRRIFGKERKPGVSRFVWFSILPKVFFRSWRETAFDELRGMHRVL